MRLMFLAAIMLAATVSESASWTKVAYIPWGKQIRQTVTESGDTIAIEAICSRNDTLYVYDLGASRLLAYTLKGEFLRSIALTGCPRTGWQGSDVVATADAFVFVNSQDRTLDYYTIANGTFMFSRAFPKDFLGTIGSRKSLFVSNIYSDGVQLHLGNPERALPITGGFAKVANSENAKALTPPWGCRFAALGKHSIYTKKNNLISANTIVGPYPQSHFRPQGKQFTERNNVLYGFRNDKKGLYIEKIKLP